jgi:hypothetical protein
VAELAEFAGRAPREGLSSYTGIPQCRRAIELAHENAWSPQEVTMMLIWILDAGLPPPLMNQPVFDLAGRHLGTPDLFDVETGAAGEYHGALHLVDQQPSRDRDRDERFRDVGLEPFVMRAGDSLDRPAAAQRMRAARDRARRIPDRFRAWTIESPSWWIPTTTVAQRRALTDLQKARLLAYRDVA